MGPVSMVTLDVGGQTLMLLPQRAVFLPESDTLVVADAYIGKAPSFRPPGEPAPTGTAEQALSILTGLMRGLDVKRVVFLGDFLESLRSLAPGALAAVTRWRELHSALALTLVRGDPSEGGGDPPVALDIQVVDEPLMLRGMALCHRPRPMDGAFVLAGHLHPCVSVGGRAHDWHRLPCFWFTQRVGVLPAFGAFTGMQAIRAHHGERVFATTAERVFELLPKPKSR